MGRWSTYRRRGGGPPTSTALIQIIDVEFSGTDTLELTYSANVDATDFVASDFHTNPTTIEPSSISQINPDSISVMFGEDVDAETAIVYDGAVPGILTPQTVAL